MKQIYDPKSLNAKYIFIWFYLQFWKLYIQMHCSMFSKEVQ